jgi:SynChlorMet cassette radical SAM/SPASM protein ScmE
MTDQCDVGPETNSSMVMRTPRILDLEITSTCNLRCRYCYFFNNPSVKYGDLPTNDWLKFFAELGLLGVMSVVLAGGEPFIRKDLSSLLEGIIHNRMRFSLLSNGALIDDEIAAFLASTGRCDYVQISVDGSSADTHDVCRGQGSFDGAMRGIRTLKRHGVKVAVRVTIHRHNVHDLRAISSLLLEELGLPGFGTNSAGYLGTCRLNTEDVLLTIEERTKAMKQLLDLTEKYYGRISATAGPLAEGRLWKKMEEARAQNATAFPNGGRLTACGCPSNKIAVRSDGTVIPCLLLPHMELGHINRDSLLEIWQYNPILNQLRERHKIPLKGFEYCSDCSYRPYCTGNCPGLAYSLTGRVDHPSPEACLRRFLEEGGSIL